MFGVCIHTSPHTSCTHTHSYGHIHTHTFTTPSEYTDSDLPRYDTFVHTCTCIQYMTLHHTQSHQNAHIHTHTYIQHTHSHTHTHTHTHMHYTRFLRPYKFLLKTHHSPHHTTSTPSTHVQTTATGSNATANPNHSNERDLQEHC